jgi:hypothetical protein
MNGREMAEALGLSETMVSKLRRRGMPMDTVERARRWRRRHLEAPRTKGMRADTLGAVAPAPPAPPRPGEILLREFRRAAVFADPAGRPRMVAPAPAARYMRALVAAMPRADALALLDDLATCDVVYALCPGEFFEHGWCDDADTTGDDEPGLVVDLAAGRAALSWRPGDSWRPLAEVVTYPAAPPADVLALAREFELFEAVTPRPAAPAEASAG